MGAMCQVRIAPEGTGVFLSVCGMGGSGLGGLELIDTGGGVWIIWFTFLTGQKRK